MAEEKGQSLIELVVAIGIFVITIGSVSFLVLNNYTSGQLSKEITQANFLAQEGLEAVRSIRDNSWSNLTAGNHGLAISDNNWVFQGDSEDISSKLKEGARTIAVEEVDSNRKKVTSQVSWNFLERPQEIQLVTYLTNWQKVTSNCQGDCTPCSGLSWGFCRRQTGCSWDRRNRLCFGTCTPCENFLTRFSCIRQLGCSWLNP